MNLYRLVRPLATVAFKVYFKKIYHAGSEHIPANKPIIFSCNHPTGFFEPCILACLTWQVEYHFITRGDLFANPTFAKMMRSLNMIPIFRFRDGFSNLKNNTDSMQYIYKALSEKKSIIIFSEGGTLTEKRLRPIQKGLARMAFGSFEKYGDLDVHIVPVCCTYLKPHNFRPEVMISFGEATPLSIYTQLYNQSSPKAINQLTAEVEDAMRKLLVHVEKPENDDLAENLFTLYQNSFPDTTFPIFRKSKRRLLALREIADNVNQMPDNQLFMLKKEVDSYFSELKKLSIDDLAVAQPFHKNLKNTLALILGFIPFLIGRVVHQPAVWYAQKIRDERVRFLEFKGPVMAAVGLGVSLITYILLLILALIINNLAFWALVAIVPFLGFYAILYLEKWEKYRASSRLKVLDTEGVLHLRTERERLLTEARKNSAILK